MRADPGMLSTNDRLDRVDRHVTRLPSESVRRQRERLSEPNMTRNLPLSECRLKFRHREAKAKTSKQRAVVSAHVDRPTYLDLPHAARCRRQQKRQGVHE